MSRSLSMQESWRTIGPAHESNKCWKSSTTLVVLPISPAAKVGCRGSGARLCPDHGRFGAARPVSGLLNGLSPDHRSRRPRLCRVGRRLRAPPS